MRAWQLWPALVVQLLICAVGTASAAPPVFVRSGGAGDTSFSFDIGSPGTNRLVVVFADDESDTTNLTGVTVDGNACHLVTRANNTVGVGNHQELWYCDEDDLAGAGGTVTVAATGGDAGWAVHAHLYQGAGQDGPSDFGIDQTSASTTTVSVSSIDVPVDGLVVMGAAQGSGGKTVTSWTAPLIQRQDGPDPSSADLAEAGGIEAAAQTNTTYTATFSGGNFNRGTAIVAVWPPGPNPFTCDQSWYMVIDPGTGSQLYRFNRSTDPFTFDAIGSQYPYRLNSLAYNPNNNLMYAVVRQPGGGFVQNEIVRIEADGTATSLGVVAGLPTNYAATFMRDGTFVVGAGSRIVSLDLTTSPPTIATDVTMTGMRVTDLSVNPLDPVDDRIYFLDETGATDTVRYGNPFTGVVEGSLPNPTGTNLNAGSQFFDSFGNLYFRSNVDSNVYRVDMDPVTGGAATLVTSAPPGGSHDGASCPFSIGMEKTVNHDFVAVPYTVTYTYRISNPRSLPVSGLTFTDMLPADGRTFAAGSLVNPLGGTPNAYGGTDTLQISAAVVAANSVLDVTVDVDVPVETAGMTLLNQASLSGLDVTLGGAIDSDYPVTPIFQDPTPLQIALLTAVELVSFTATGYDRGVLLAWETGYEIDNLGFHVYREAGGERVRLTDTLVAGSGLQAGQGVAVASTLGYAWWDMEANQATPGVRYWLEDVEFDGTTTLHGPVTPVDGGHLLDVGPPAPGEGVRGANSQSLDGLGRQGRARFRRFRTGRNRDERRDRGGRSARGARRARPAATDPRETQWELASRAAVKIGVERSGWHRVSQPELVAAGLDPTVNPRSLALFVDGVEQAIRVTGAGDRRFDPTDVIEFYGVGVDTAYTQTRVYWLTTGVGRGLRVRGDRTTPRRRRARGRLGETGPSSFWATVQQKERSIYFAALENGDTENWFGPLVGGAPMDLDVSLSHLDPEAPSPAVLEVALQGVTTDSDLDPDHVVSVQVNGIGVGELVFDGRTRGIERLEVPHGVLRDGANTVTLTSSGPADLSLFDTLNLSYWHTYRADADRLRFTVEAPETVRVGGFANGAIRLIDITDPAAAREVPGRAHAEPDGSWSIAARVRGQGTRTLLAFTPATVQSPVTVEANAPSTWHRPGNRHDYLIITGAGFAAPLQDLIRLRSGQGHTPALIDIGDVYDEYSFGQKTPQALKDFLTRARTQWAQPPRFVVLGGDATSDPRDYAGFGDADLVPTKLVAMDSVELESATDEWFADVDDDGASELAVGRLPFRTIAQAEIMVAKLVGYARADAGPWTKRTLLVADKQDPSWDFGDDAERLAALLPAGFTAQHINLDELGVGAARDRMFHEVAEGQLLVNYLGHGSTYLWGTDGTLLTRPDLTESWQAGARLPVVVAMNCLNGFFQGIYDEESLAETLLRSPEGAVATWASSSLTYAAPQSEVNRAFFELALSGRYESIGEALGAAKRTVADRDIRRSWIFFGDPAMRLKAVPTTPERLTDEASDTPLTAVGTEPSGESDDREAPETGPDPARLAPRYLADFDGDGRADPFLYAPETAQWWLEGSGPGGSRVGAGPWGQSAALFAARLNDDLLADVLGYDADTGRWSQSLNNGDGTFTTTWGEWAPEWRVAVGDLDGDQRDDVLLSTADRGLWIQGLSDGGGDFTYRGGADLPPGALRLVDLNGNRRSDLFIVDHDRDRWFVGLTARRSATSFVSGTGVPPGTVHPANIDGNGWTDLLFVEAASGNWASWRIAPPGRVAKTRGQWEPMAGGAVAIADLNGDGLDDVVRYDPATGGWTAHLLTDDSSSVDQHGVWPSGRQLAVGDLDGDGADDLFSYDPATGGWSQHLATVVDGGSVVFTDVHGTSAGSQTLVGR